jgi:hypothetical protein
MNRYKQHLLFWAFITTALFANAVPKPFFTLTTRMVPIYRKIQKWQNWRFMPIWNII